MLLCLHFVYLRIFCISLFSPFKWQIFTVESCWYKQLIPLSQAQNARLSLCVVFKCSFLVPSLAFVALKSTRFVPAFKSLFVLNRHPRAKPKGLSVFVSSEHHQCRSLCCLNSHKRIWDFHLFFVKYTTQVTGRLAQYTQQLI